jgi:hypothetical protein
MTKLGEILKRITSKPRELFNSAGGANGGASAAVSQRRPSGIEQLAMREASSVEGVMAPQRKLRISVTKPEGFQALETRAEHVVTLSNAKECLKQFASERENIPINFQIELMKTLKASIQKLPKSEQEEAETQYEKEYRDVLNQLDSTAKQIQTLPEFQTHLKLINPQDSSLKFPADIQTNVVETLCGRVEKIRESDREEAETTLLGAAKTMSWPIYDIVRLAIHQKEKREPD